MMFRMCVSAKLTLLSQIWKSKQTKPTDKQTKVQQNIPQTLQLSPPYPHNNELKCIL